MGRLDTEARMIIKVLSSRGTMTSDIARLLDVTERTVRYHLERLHLSAVDGCSRQLFRAEAVAEAIETWRAAQEDGSINLAALHHWLVGEHDYAGSLRSVQRYWVRR